MKLSRFRPGPRAVSIFAHCMAFASIIGIVLMATSVLYVIAMGFLRIGEVTKPTTMTLDAALGVLGLFVSTFFLGGLFEKYLAHRRKRKPG